MMINRIVALSLSLVISVLLCQRAIAQDFVPGEVPGQQEIAELEKQATARPGDFHLARKLGKAYFFQVFGEGRKSSIEKSVKWLERALEIKAGDAETTAYLGAMTAIMAREKRDLGLLNRAIELSKRAEDLAPDDVAVLSVTGVTFLNLPETLGLTARALESMEKVRKRMGPAFSRMSHHGQQRVLLTEGQAYVKLKQIGKARECFEQALKINQESVEANAVSYLLKPINRERLAQAVERALKLASNEARAAEEDRRVRRAVNQAAPPLTQVVARRRDRFVLLPLNQIVFFEVENGVVRAKTESESYWTDYRINDLESRLPDPPFFRAHRSAIVNLGKAREIAPLMKGAYLLVMNDKESSEIQVSERQSKRLRQILQT